MKSKGCYELIVRDSRGKELFNQTFPLDSTVGIIEKTYPTELNGWCREKLLFSNLKTKAEDLITYESLVSDGFKITRSQYDQLALLDITSNCKCSTYEVLKVLKILGFI